MPFNSAHELRSTQGNAVDVRMLKETDVVRAVAMIVILFNEFVLLEAVSCYALL